MGKRLRILLLNPADNVVVLLEKGCKGDSIYANNREILLLEDIDFAHKVLIRDAQLNVPIIKYGTEIGYLTRPALRGAWIHAHNMGCDRGKTRRVDR